MSALRWARPPGGEPVRLSEISKVLGMEAPADQLRRRLSETLGWPEAAIQLRRSGRDALRSVFEAWHRTSGRSEIVVPAYTCYSVPAAAVAAGLRVRLVEVDLDGRIDLDALAETDLSGAAGIVVCNLFGRAEEMDPIAAVAAAAGIPVLDDAAQSLGAVDRTGRRVGQRGVPAVLSFGRGKPLQGLGGGAAIGLATDSECRESPTRETASARAKALVTSAVWDASLTRPVFSLLARIPSLGIGQTEFEPGFATGPIDPANAAIAAAQLEDFEGRARARRARARRLAERITAETKFAVLVDQADLERGVYSRLVLRAPSAGARSRALAGLNERGAGASALYPDSLADVAPLLASRADEPGRDLPGSRELAARVLTLPTNRDRSAEEVDAAVRCLVEAERG